MTPGYMDSRASATIFLVFRTLRHCEPTVERELADALTPGYHRNCQAKLPTQISRQQGNRIKVLGYSIQDTRWLRSEK
jgi:hypothetical protein